MYDILFFGTFVRSFPFRVIIYLLNPQNSTLFTQSYFLLGFEIIIPKTKIIKNTQKKVTPNVQRFAVTPEFSAFRLTKGGFILQHIIWVCTLIPQRLTPFCFEDFPARFVDFARLFVHFPRLFEDLCLQYKNNPP